MPVPIPLAQPVAANISGQISSQGVVQEDIVIATANNEIVLEIAEDTMSLTAEGAPVEVITVVPLAETPEPPLPESGISVVGYATDFGPDGATFDPPIKVTLQIDLTKIPEGASVEDLVVAWLDTDTGDWIGIPGSVVDLAAGIVEAPVSHFTPFAIIAKIAVDVTPEPEPASTPTT